MGRVRVRGPSARANPLTVKERIESLVRLAGCTGVGIGSAVLLGWLLDLPALKGILPGLALMQPNTALSLALQHAYRLGDLSLVYPLARGTGPILSATSPRPGR